MEELNVCLRDTPDVGQVLESVTGVCQNREFDPKDGSLSVWCSFKTTRNGYPQKHTFVWSILSFLYPLRKPVSLFLRWYPVSCVGML